MANKMTDMSKIRKVLYLRSQKKAILFISKYLSVSRNTVKKYLALQRILGLKIDDLNQKSDSELEELFSQTQEKIVSVRVQSAYDFFPYMDKELKKTGVTKFSMWEEYYSKTLMDLKAACFTVITERGAKR